MKYIFSQSLEDTYDENGKKGIIFLWIRTIIDFGKSIVFQHVENQKGGGFMKRQKKDLIMQNKIFGLIGAATAAILSLPYLAMQLQWVKPNPSNPADRGVDWSLGDFVIAGVLLFGMGSLFVFIARRVNKKYRLVVALSVLAVFLLIWVHLAVGIVDSWPFAGS